MSNGSVTITIEEYRRLKKISDSALYCIGWIDESAKTDKSKDDLRGTIETVKYRLESAVAK